MGTMVYLGKSETDLNLESVLFLITEEEYACGIISGICCLPEP